MRAARDTVHEYSTLKLFRRRPSAAILSWRGVSGPRTLPYNAHLAPAHVVGKHQHDVRSVLRRLRRVIRRRDNAANRQRRKKEGCGNPSERVSQHGRLQARVQLRPFRSERQAARQASKSAKISNTCRAQSAKAQGVSEAWRLGVFARGPRWNAWRLSARANQMPPDVVKYLQRSRYMPTDTLGEFEQSLLLAIAHIDRRPMA